MNRFDYDVVCIGFGWSGMLVAKHCLEHDLSVKVIEKRGEAGGVWTFSPDPNTPSVMENTHTSSSRYVTEMADFPMPDDYSHFPHHSDVKAYLDEYCNEFDLLSHVQFNTECTQISKEGDVWVVDTRDESWRAGHVVIASGLHQFPSRALQDKLFSTFTGKVMHASQFKSADDIDPEETVLVLGGGETACDIAGEISLRSPGVYQSIPNGQWIIRKFQKNHSLGIKNLVFDTVTTHFMDVISPITNYSYGQTEMGELIYGKNFHGVEEWTTTRPPDRGFITKIGEEYLNTYVRNGQIIPKRKVTGSEGKTVYFDDGSQVEVDRVIMATGFDLRLPFFNNELANLDIQSLYKYIFYNPDPTLAFVGFVRPQLGSIPVIAEMASRLIAKSWSGEVDLPSEAERVQTTAEDKAFWNNHYRHTSLRIKGLVEQRTYLDQLAEILDSKPNFWRLFFTKPFLWFALMFSPIFNSAQYILDDETHGAAAARRLKGRVVYYQILIPILLLPTVPIGWLVRRFILWRDGNAAQNRIEEPVVQLDTN